jgi:hypothetical protein
VTHFPPSFRPPGNIDPRSLAEDGLRFKGSAPESRLPKPLSGELLPAETGGGDAFDDLALEAGERLTPAARLLVVAGGNI